MKIEAKTVRYIKLGRGGRWEKLSLSNGELHFGYGGITHELALTCDIALMRDHRLKAGKKPQSASREAKEVADFYGLGSDCLWVTFADGYLWWTFAEPEVTWLGGNGEITGERMRKSIGGWRNSDVNGVPLRVETLSTALTKVGAYRRTICGIEDQDYLLRRINGLDEPIVEEATRIRESMLEVMQKALKSLHQKDFETLVDIIFARNGWNRASEVGGTQADIDLILEQPTLNERAGVQVKSAASQKTLDDYINRIDASDQYDRFFFVCHSPSGDIRAPLDRDDIYVWTGRELAATVLKCGLYDWVIEKIHPGRVVAAA